MTRPTPPPADRQFARDVAKQIDRRRMKRRMTLWSALLALAAAAGLYLRCGGGLGLGGAGLGGDDSGGGDSSDGASRPAAAVPRCTIRISADGISIAGRARSRDQAVAACKAAPGVDVFPAGDARHGDVEDLRATLEAAGAKGIVVHPPPRASETPRAPPPN
jgi:hypothetical protein